MYNTHPHINTQEVSTSAKNGNERITYSHCAINPKRSRSLTAVTGIIALTTAADHAAR